jgi:ubiquinone biosynthesis protein Coq4
MKDQLFEKMYEISKKPYQKFLKKNQPWAIEKETLLQMEPTTLGYSLGAFLDKNHFDLQDKLEDHDVMHVLTNTGITVLEEIGMQYYLFGNGKRSLYMYLVLVWGTCFYPTRLGYFITQYRRGKSAYSFHQLDFLKMLTVPVKTIQQTFNIS